jgi:hypothetical protein
VSFIGWQPKFKAGNHLGKHKHTFELKANLEDAVYAPFVEKVARSEHPDDPQRYRLHL